MWQTRRSWSPGHLFASRGPVRKRTLTPGVRRRGDGRPGGSLVIFAAARQGGVVAAATEKPNLVRMTWYMPVSANAAGDG